ncbi:MAG: hypothetical protein KUF74_08570 [Candidatus Thiodiazotropha sp. (ex Ctena orbiculata)]|nr:hypothetical protein [Candidatus Thiodiazotropha taylori]
MKKLLIGTSGLLASGPLLAHVGEHSEESFFSIILHLIAEHPLPLILVAGIVGVVTVKRLLSD